jgi:Putative metallopeptidase
MRIPIILLIAAVLWPLHADAAPSKSARAARVDIRYVAPTSADLEPVYKFLKEHEALELARELLSPLRLPRRLLIKTETCGTSDAWYEKGVITICYEFLDDFWKNAATETTPIGLAPIDTVIGPFIDLVLHEAGHAVFEMLRIPVFGREEDAADQFSAYIALQFGRADARRLILGNAWQYRKDLEAGGPPPALKTFADTHGTSAQRFFNVLCIGYGADPKLFQDVVDKGYLPKERAEGCADEYRQVAHAMNVLIMPHVDRRRAEQVLKIEWLPPSTALPTARRHYDKSRRRGSPALPPR